MSYPGGKAGAGVYQTLINLMPPHRVYIEAFLGGGAILRYKRPAQNSIAIDADAQVLTAFSGESGSGLPNVKLIHGDAARILASWPRHFWREDVLLYCDPPYLMSTRSSQRPIYRHELLTEEEHTALLRILLEMASLGVMVMISGYASSLYSTMLANWRCVTFPAMTRGGRVATEHVWMSYPEPAELHDYRYLGSNYRERERIKRKQARWKNRLETMPALERYALLSTIEELRVSCSHHQTERGDFSHFPAAGIVDFGEDCRQSPPDVAVSSIVSSIAENVGAAAPLEKAVRTCASVLEDTDESCDGRPCCSPGQHPSEMAIAPGKDVTVLMNARLLL